MNYHVLHLRPEGYKHAETFTDLHDGLRGGLEDLDRLGSDRAIVLGAHVDPHKWLIPDDAVIFNTEVPSSGWFTDHYISFLRSHEVWDYSHENIKVMRERWGIEAKFCGIGYHEI